MSKFKKLALISLLLSTSIYASDLLLEATNGAVSDNSIGVKELSADEMSKVLGGYVFDRAPHFDFNTDNPATRSYAYVVLDNDDNRDAGVVASEYNLEENEVMVAKARYDFGNRKYRTYLQVYNIQSNQLVRDYFLDPKSQQIIDEFEIFISTHL